MSNNEIYVNKDSNRIYVIPTSDKPIKLVYEGGLDITWDRDIGTISIPAQRFGSFSFDNCTIDMAVLNDLTKALDRKQAESNNGVYFRSLL